jgi:hypothetical protein
MSAYLPTGETIVEHISVPKTEPASVTVQGDTLLSFIEAPIDATDSQGDAIFKGMMAGLIGDGDAVPTVTDNVSLVHGLGRGNGDMRDIHDDPFWAGSSFTEHTGIGNGDAVPTSVADNVSLVHLVMSLKDYSFWRAA